MLLDLLLAQDRNRRGVASWENESNVDVESDSDEGSDSEEGEGLSLEEGGNDQEWMPGTHV